MIRGQRQRNAKRRAKIRCQRYVVEYLKAHSCIDCGELDILVLDFDHINPAKKLADVSRLINDGSFNKLIKEIAKCDVRCANCHRKKTALDNGSYRLHEISDDEIPDKMAGFEKKLSNRKAKNIRRKFNTNKYTKAKLARDYNVKWISIHRIINGKSYNDE